MAQFPQQNWGPQPPSPYSVPNYYSGGAPMGNQRPGAVTGLAVTGIIVGAIGILACGGATAVNVAMAANGGKNPNAPQLPTVDTTFMVEQSIQSSFNVLLSLVLLIASIAALWLKPLARKVLLAWSGIMLVWLIASMVIALAYAIPKMEAMNPASANNPGLRVGHLIGAIMTPVLMGILPVLFLTMWNRPHVKSAFGAPVLPAPLPPPQ